MTNGVYVSTDAINRQVKRLNQKKAKRKKKKQLIYNVLKLEEKN